MQDPDFKAQLKEKATELAMEVWLAFNGLRRGRHLSNNTPQIMFEEPEKDGSKATKKRKANSKQETTEERPTKRVRQAAPKVNKKQVTSDFESDLEMEVNSKIKVLGQKKPKQSKQTIDDSSEEDEETPSRKAKQAKQREYSSALDSDSGAVVPPKSPEVGALWQSKLVTHTCISTGDQKCSGRRETHTCCRRRRGDNCQRMAHELMLMCSQMSDSALSIVIDGTPTKVKRTKKEDKKMV